MNSKLKMLLEGAVLDASSDHYRWSRGKYLYDSGIEHLMEVYAAKAIYEAFRLENNLKVELQYKTRKLEESGIKFSEKFRHGRIDLFVDGGCNGLFFVEFKRHLNTGTINSDICRLVDLTQATKSANLSSIGYLVGPMYQYAGKNHDYKSNYDYHLKLSRELWTGNSIVATVGNDSIIPGFDTYRGERDRHLAIIVEVGTI